MAAFTKTLAKTDITLIKTVNQQPTFSCNRSHLTAAKKLLQFVHPLLLTASLIAHNVSADPLETTQATTTSSPEYTEAHISATINPSGGAWSNTTNGSTVGLNLIDQLECEMFLEREFAQKVTTHCQYKKIDESYFIYLKSSNGECDEQADFMFTLNESSKSLNLIIDGTIIELHFMGAIKAGTSHPNPSNLKPVN